MRSLSASHGRPSIRPSFGHVYLKAGGVWLAWRRLRVESALARSLVLCKSLFCLCVCLTSSAFPRRAAESKGKFYEGMMSFESLDWSVLHSGQRGRRTNPLRVSKYSIHSTFAAARSNNPLSPSLGPVHFGHRGRITTRPISQELRNSKGALHK